MSLSSAEVQWSVRAEPLSKVRNLRTLFAPALILLSGLPSQNSLGDSAEERGEMLDWLFELILVCVTKIYVGILAHFSILFTRFLVFGYMTKIIANCLNRTKNASNASCYMLRKLNWTAHYTFMGQYLDTDLVARSIVWFHFITKPFMLMNPNNMLIIQLLNTPGTVKKCA